MSDTSQTEKKQQSRAVLFAKDFIAGTGTQLEAGKLIDKCTEPSDRKLGLDWK